MKFQLKNDFFMDYSFLFNQSFGVRREDLISYGNRIRRAVQSVNYMREYGFRESDEKKDHPIYFPRLPYIEKEDGLFPSHEKKRLHILKERCGRGDFDIAVSIGIGGSYLGNQVLFDMVCGPFWNLMDKEKRRGRPQVFFAGENEDPEGLEALLCHIRRCSAVHKNRLRILILVISKSGTTIEPMSALEVLSAQLQDMNVQVEYAAVTDPNKGYLHDLALKKDWIFFTVPEGIGGRFSVFSQVGLVFGAIIGLDIADFLAGARFIDKACKKTSVEENPALASAVFRYAASEKYHIATEVIMPYGDSMRSLGQWYAQLLGESLGKKRNRRGEIVHYGRTPVSALGSTDMHSLTQEHQEGPKNKLIQFVTVRERRSDFCVSCGGERGSSALPMSDILNHAQQANAEALASEGRMSCCLAMKNADAFHLGGIMYFFCLCIAYEGELSLVDAYDQPGVETYKKILKGYLRTGHVENS